MRVDDYSVTPVQLHSDMHGGSVYVPQVSLFYNGGLAWQGASWRIAAHMMDCKRSFGDPPWREPIDIEIRCVGVDGACKRYVIL